jgi:hypothetical protein
MPHLPKTPRLQKPPAKAWTALYSLSSERTALRNVDCLWFSVVVDLEREDRMLIRARCRADIFNLFNAHQDLPSIERPASDESRDYRWRMSIGKADWVQLAARLAEGVDYSNFKNTVHEQPDQGSKGRAYLVIWRAMRDVQLTEGPESPKSPKLKRSKRRRL